MPALGEEEGEGTSTMMIYQWPWQWQWQWPWPGFLFSPSDEELVDQYLIKNKTDPWGIIREFDVYSKDPWDLPGGFLHGQNKNEELFFTPRRCKSARGNGSRVDRTAGSGYWHTNSSSKIHCSSGLVAYKTSLTFKIKDARTGNWVGTDWIMQEYLLSPGDGRFQEKALCKVYNKKKKKGRKQTEEESWSRPPPPSSKRAWIEVEDEVEVEVVHHQETQEEEGDVGWATVTEVVHHQETEEEEGDVGWTTATEVVHHQETEEEEGDVGWVSAVAVHQEEISQPTSYLESPSTSTAQETAALGLDQYLIAQNSSKEMEALPQAQVQISEETSGVFSSLVEIYCLQPDSDFTLQDRFLTFQKPLNEMEAETQVQISEEASAASDVFPPLDSPPPNSDFTQIAQNKEMEAQAQVEVSEENSDVFSALDDIYCAPPKSIFSLADQPLWEWDSSSFGVGGDMGMYSGFAQEASQLLPPHNSNPVNAA